MIEACRERDIAAAVELLNLTGAADARIRWRRALEDPGTRAVVAIEDGRVAGAGMCATVPDYRGQLQVGVAVRPDARGRGIGTALVTELARFAGEDSGRAAGGRPGRPAGEFATTLRDDVPDGLRFAERAGLSVVNHCIGWTIELAEPEALRAAADEAAARSGVRLDETTMGEGRERFVAAAAGSVAGMPTDTPMDLERFAAGMPDEVVLIFASDHGGTAGVCLIRPDGDAGGWHTSYTGVVTRCRRRGVARALKLGSFATAAAHGGTGMHGENDARNAPMLALSEAVGMRRGLGYYSLAGARIRAPRRS